MATTLTWTGGGADDEVMTAGNWSPAQAPVDGDTLVVTATSDAIVNTGGGDTGLDTMKLKFGTGFTGTWGTSAEPIWMDCTSILFDSGGSAHYITGIATTVTVTGGIQGANTLSFDASANTDIGTLKIIGGEGTYTVGANAVLDDLVVAGAPAAIVTVAANVTSLDTVDISDGQVSISSAAGTSIVCRGGTTTVTGAASTALLETYDDASVIWDASGTATTLATYGNSRVDGSSNPNATVAAPGTMTVNGDSVVDLRNGLGTFTGWSWTNNGGLVYPPVGSTVTLS